VTFVRPRRESGKAYEYAWDVEASGRHRLSIRSYLQVAHNKTEVTLDGAPLLELMDADTAGRLCLHLDGEPFELRWIISSAWLDDAFVLMRGQTIVARSGNPDGIRRLSGAAFHIEDVRPKGCGDLLGLAALASTLAPGAGGPA